MRLSRPDPDHIRRLQDEAARRPAAYRFKVYTLALLGDVTLTAAQLLPIALIIGVPLFVMNAALTKGSLALINGAGVLAMLLWIWITRPQHRFDGTEITPKDAPDFFRHIDALREKLAVAPRMRVLIDDDFNASADAMANALTRLEVYSRLWGGGFRKVINRWRVAEAQAPADYLERFTRALPDWPAKELERWLQQALAEKPNWIDTHPLLPERVGALKQAAAIGATDGPCAGEALFGAHWSVIKRDFNQRWQQRMQPKWQFYREYRKQVVQPLLDMDNEHASALPAEAQLLRAEALMEEDAESGQQALIALTERHANDAEVWLRAGIALSERAPERAMVLLQRVAPLDASYRAESFRGLRRLYEARGDSKEADRYAARMDNAGKHAARAHTRLIEALLKGDVQASVLSATAKSLIASAAQADACVAELWWFARDVEVPVQLAIGEQKPIIYPMQVGLWVIDPELLRRAGEDEDDVGERYTAYLQTLLPSNVLISGKAVYTTENRERWLLDVMQKLPQACCYRRV